LMRTENRDDGGGVPAALVDDSSSDLRSRLRTSR